MKFNTTDIRGFLELLQAWRDQVAKTRGPNDIVVDPGDEIICDFCNELINHEDADPVETKIYYNDSRALCFDCYKMFAEKPMGGSDG